MTSQKSNKDIHNNGFLNSDLPMDSVVTVSYNRLLSSPLSLHSEIGKNIYNPILIINYIY